MPNLREIILERTMYLRDSWQGNADTHQTRYFRQIWGQLVKRRGRFECIVDPFARDCEYGHYTNDINPDTNAQSNMDALDWLKTLENDIADCVILDPPFSDTTNERVYGYKSNFYQDPSYFKGVMMEIGRILKPGGCCLKFGYNTSTLNLSLEVKSLWIVNFFGPRNDVLVTELEQVNQTLEAFI